MIAFVFGRIFSLFFVMINWDMDEMDRFTEARAVVMGPFVDIVEI